MSKDIELHVDLSYVLERLDDDDLVEEIKIRGLEYEFETEDEDEDKIREVEYEDLKKNNHVLPKDFDRFQLRDHLINIAGLGSYVSEETLFNKLSDLLEFS